MTAKELHDEIYAWMSEKPKNWREGQAVFNYVDEVYGVARIVQFQHHIDCFYWDDTIDEFIEKCAEIITEIQNNEN